MFRPLSLINRGRRAPAASGREDADPFFQLQSEMNRLFDEAFSGFGAPSAFRSSFSGDATPRIDMRETDTSYEIEAELPGVDENDLHVELNDNVITVRGEKRFEREDEDKKGGYHVMERSYGSFARSIPLPVDVDPESVDAAFKNGVLKLTVPKPPEAAEKSKRIEIKRG